MACTCPSDAVWCIKVVDLRAVGVELAGKEEKREVREWLDEARPVRLGISVEVAIKDAGEGG